MPNPFQANPKFDEWFEDAATRASARQRLGLHQYGDGYAFLGLEGMAYRILEKALRLQKLAKDEGTIPIPCNTLTASQAYCSRGKNLLDTVLDLHALAWLAHAWVLGELPQVVTMREMTKEEWEAKRCGLKEANDPTCGGYASGGNR